MLRLAARLYLGASLLAAPVVLALGPGQLPGFGWLALAAGLAALATPGAVILLLRWYNPPTTAFIRQTRAALRQQGAAAEVEHHWTGADGLPDHLRLAAIAAEDLYFALHQGFDWDSLRAALAHNRGGGPPRGGSTISQQVAKNLFLSPARALARKLVEAYLTLLIEAAWPKTRILEVYLNIAQFGPRHFGAEAGARLWFGRPARTLNAQEAALLVTVLPSPSNCRADQPSPVMRYRQVMILRTMKKMGAGYLARMRSQPGPAAP
jgi:monofunctional biosynthetic peptidoglycan transglycosylase